ncbi:MAG TPA: hypothetical protein VEG68_18130 [Terriglobales bacterium]|nr:hypothetical protein [Terriglobales bacterium]
MNCVIRVLVFVLGFVSMARAQDIHIRVVNGHNGKPIAHECLNVFVGTERGSNLVAGTNKDGIAVLHVGNGEILAETPCQDWPARVSAYSDEIRVTCGGFHVACQLYGKRIP